jgi:hypothetical protein
MVIGALTFQKILEKKFYTHLKGGILEAFGRLFTENLKVYLYPGRQKQTHKILTSANMPVEDDVRFLYQHLLESGLIIDITNYREEILPFFSYKVLAKLNANDPEWEEMVPKYVSSFIKNKNLFGYGSKKQEPVVKNEKP